MAEKPTDRYASAQEVAGDLERWLGDERVSAYREPVLARLGRWARRRKTLVATVVTLLFTATVALAIGTQLVAARDRAELARQEEENEKLKAQAGEQDAKIAQQAEEQAKLKAQREEQMAETKKAEAERISKELAGLFTLPDATGWRGNVFRTGSEAGDKVRARDILDRARNKLGQANEMTPLVKATLMGTIGDDYRVLGIYDKAEPLLKEAYDIQIEQHGSVADPDVAESLHRLASLRHGQGEYQEARKLYEQALAMRRELNLSDEVAATELGLASLLMDMWEFDDGEKLFLQVIDQRSQVPGDRARRDVALAQAGMSALLLSSGREGGRPIPDYQRYMLTALPVLSPESATDIVKVSWLWVQGIDTGLEALKNSKNDRSKLAGLASAEATLEKSETLARQHLGLDHPIVGLIRARRAEFALCANDYQLAEKHCCELKKCLESSLGYTNPRATQVVKFIADVFLRSGKQSEAEGVFEDMLQARARHKGFGRDHPAYADALTAYATFLEDKCKAKERALACYREAAPIYRKTTSRYNNAAVGLARGGSLALDMGFPSEAELLLRDGLALAPKSLGEEFNAGQTLETLAVARVILGKYPEAEMDFSNAKWPHNNRGDKGSYWRCHHASWLVHVINSGDAMVIRKSVEDLAKGVGESRDIPMAPAAVAVSRHLVLVPPLPGKEPDGLHWAERTKGDPEYARLRGAALYRAGKWQEAVTQLENAIEAEPEHATPYLFLAMARFQLKDREGAEQALELGMCSHAWADQTTAAAWRHLEWRDGLQFDFLLREVKELLGRSRN